MRKIIVAFDLYGTLLSTASISDALEGYYGADISKTLAANWRRYQLEYSWRSNSMKKYEDFHKLTRKSLYHVLREQQIEIDETVIDELMKRYDSLSVFDDVLPALEKLSALPNVEKLIFSNGTRSMITNSVQGSKDLSSQSFLQPVSVDYVRSFKPAPETYRYLIQCLGKTGQEKDVWLVSCNPFDAVGGLAAGINVAWIDRERKGWHDRLSGEPKHVLHSLEEVAKVIEQQSKNGDTKI